MGRWASVALVLGLHLLLLLGLQWGMRRGSGPAVALAPARIEFFLPPLARPLPNPHPQPNPQPNISEVRRPSPVSPPTEAAIENPPAAAATPAEASMDAPRARLILTLPPLAASAPRNPALIDPRTNTARQTLEEKMAQALDNTVHDQLQADGTTIRRRVGNECVDLHESRAVQLMPDVEFLRYAPRASGKAYKCK